MAVQAAGRERAAIVTRQQMGTTAAAAEPQANGAPTAQPGADGGEDGAELPEPNACPLL